MGVHHNGKAQDQLDTSGWHDSLTNAATTRHAFYDDLTAIDWVFEYSRERQRLRQLYSSASGLLGYLKRFLDGSKIWVVLIATGILTGVLAASIDVASDWLADLKTGFCRNGGQDTGGRFYLNKVFCCWGLDQYAQCKDWVPWSVALRVFRKGGSWVVGYAFFSTFSVGLLPFTQILLLFDVGLKPSQILFAACASILVNHYAMDAKQSGIPEIKTMLGGFVMRRFLVPWVLLVKSLGLVRVF